MMTKRNTQKHRKRARAWGETRRSDAVVGAVVGALRTTVVATNWVVPAWRNADAPRSNRGEA